MKPLLSILSISLLAACSNPSETIQQAPSAPAPAPNTASIPAAAPTPAAGEDLSMVSHTQEFKKPQSTQEDAVLVESTMYSKTQNSPVLLTRHTVLPQDRLNQDHKTHGLVCWNCENHLSSYFDLASTRFDPDTPSGVYFNMIINSTDEEAGNAPRSSILKLHINCANGQGTLLTNTLYNHFFGRGQALTRDIPRNETFVLDPHTVTPKPSPPPKPAAYRHARCGTAAWPWKNSKPPSSTKTCNAGRNVSKAADRLPENRTHTM